MEVGGHCGGQSVDGEAVHDGLRLAPIHHEAGLSAVRLGERGWAAQSGEAEAAEAVGGGRGLERGPGE